MILLLLLAIVFENASFFIPITLITAKRQLADYESGVNTSQQSELSIHGTLDSLTRSCVEMETSANMEGARREMWKQRVRGLADEVYQLRTAFTRAQQQNPHSAYSQQASAAAVRNELFGRSANGERAQLSAVDSFARQNDSLNRSHHMMDELHEMGSRALDSLRVQRGTLKGAHRKALDVANILGMSNSLMKMIGREDQTNAMITYGCMIFSVLVVVTIWWYFR